MNDLHEFADEVLRRLKAGEIEELKQVAERLALSCKLHVCRLEHHTMTFTSSGASGQISENTAIPYNVSTTTTSNELPPPKQKRKPKTEKQ